MKTITQPLSGASKLWTFWITCLLIVISFGVVAQQAPPPPSATITQARNGTPSNPVSPVNWTGGNVGNQQGHYVECWSIPYRCEMPNMPANLNVEIIFEYDLTHSSKQAIDFITNYNNMDDNFYSAPHSIFNHIPEAIEPWDDTGLDGTFNDEAVIPHPPIRPAGFSMPGQPFPGAEPTLTYHNIITDPGYEGLGKITLFDANGSAYFYEGGTGSFDLDSTTTAPSAFEYLAPYGSHALAQGQQQFKVFFNTGDGGTIVLAWGGHIASTATWGVDPDTQEPNSAVAISGSPYHMRVIDWTGFTEDPQNPGQYTIAYSLPNLGNQDLSLNADAVYSAPPCDYTVTSSPFCVGEGGMASLDQTDPEWTYSWEIVEDDPLNPTGALFDNGLTTISGSPIVYFNATAGGSFTLLSQVTINYSGEILTSTCGAETPVLVYCPPAWDLPPESLPQDEIVECIPDLTGIEDLTWSDCQGGGGNAVATWEQTGGTVREPI